jgi:hypothetical protein
MFQRLFVSFEMHRTRSLDSKLFAPADARVGDRNSRAIPVNRASYSDERSGSSSLCIARYASSSAVLHGPL